MFDQAWLLEMASQNGDDIGKMARELLDTRGELERARSEKDVMFNGLMAAQAEIREKMTTMAEERATYQEALHTWETDQRGLEALSLTIKLMEDEQRILRAQLERATRREDLLFEATRK